MTKSKVTHELGTYEIRENFDLALPARGESLGITIDFVAGRFVPNLTPCVGLMLLEVLRYMAWCATVFYLAVLCCVASCCFRPGRGHVVKW